MRRLIDTAVVIAALATPQAVEAGAATHRPSALPHVLVEPIFGIDYNPSVVRYPAMPVRIREVCKDFTDPNGWVFAHTRKAGADYYIVMSWRPDQDNDSLGAAVRLFGGTCEESDAGNMFTGFVPKHGYAATTDTSPPHLPGVHAPSIRNDGDTMGNYHYVFSSAAEEEVFRDLIRHGEAEGERIWGAARFKARVCTPENPKDDRDKMVPVYMEELHRYCKAR